MGTVRGIPFYRNRTVIEAADQVAVLLMDYGYSPRSRDDVVCYLVAHGTLEGAPVDPEDMADAEMVFVASLPPVPFDSPAWGSAEDLEGLDVPPVCGGGPEPFVPSEADWEDYRRWAEETDAREELRALEARRNPTYGYE